MHRYLEIALRKKVSQWTKVCVINVSRHQPILSACDWWHFRVPEIDFPISYNMLIFFNFYRQIPNDGKINFFSILNVRFPKKILKLKQKHFKLTIPYCV